MCDEGTHWIGNVEPDDDWREEVERRNAGENVRPDEATKIHDWRLHCLIEAGYELEDARQLAQEPWHRVDLRAAVALVERGCPPHLAAAILR